MMGVVGLSPCLLDPGVALAILFQKETALGPVICADRALGMDSLPHLLWYHRGYGSGGFSINPSSYPSCLSFQSDR